MVDDLGHLSDSRISEPLKRLIINSAPKLLPYIPN